MNTPNTNKWNFAKVKTIALMSLLTLATMFYSCGEDPIITPPDPPKPPEPPKPVVVDTIPTQIKSVADLDALFKSMPDVQPDTIRKFYDVLVANNLLMQSDGAGNFDPNTLNLMTKFGDLATGNRKDQRVKGMSFGGKAPGDGDGDDKFIFANDSIHITPAIWAQMKKPALGATQQQGGKGFYANAEDVGGFDPFASILRIIQSAPGTYTIPNSGVVVSEIANIEKDIESGKTVLIDILGDLGTNNDNKGPIERFIDIVGGNKANVTGALKIYAAAGADSIHVNKNIIDKLIAAKGVIINGDGYFFIPNITKDDIPTIKGIMADNTKVRTDNDKDFELLQNGVIANKHTFTKEVENFGQNLSKLPVRSGRMSQGTGIPGQYVFDIQGLPDGVQKHHEDFKGHPVSDLNDTNARRISQPAVRGTKNYPYPDIYVNGDLAIRQFSITQLDDSLNAGTLQRIRAHQAMCQNQYYDAMGLYQMKVTSREGAPFMFYSSPESTVKWYYDGVVGDDFVSPSPYHSPIPLTLVHIHSIAPGAAAMSRTMTGGDFHYSLSLEYCFVVPDSWLVNNSGEERKNLFGFMMQWGPSILSDYPVYMGNGDFPMYVITESQLKKMTGKVARHIAFTNFNEPGR